LHREGIFILQEVKMMPNAKILEEKKALVASLVEKIKNSPAGVLVDYKGINVEDDTKLRKQLREAGVEYAVIKNTLIRFAAKELGFDELDACLHGTTALAISTTDDVVAPAKILADFAKTHENFTLKAGYLEGKAIGEDEVKKLAAMPSKETLIAQVLYSFNYPIMQLAIACDAIVKKAEGNEEMKVAELVAPKEAAAEEAAE
jgi:large subunit ribosomal protein L10